MATKKINKKNGKKIEFTTGEQDLVTEKKKGPKKTSSSKRKGKKKVDVKKTSRDEDVVPRTTNLDTVLDTARRFKSTDKWAESVSVRGVGSLFAQGREKEKKCFAIGGVITDLISNLKGQSYAIAGTGFNLDGTPIQRVKGRNWEESYTQLLTYLATAEAFGCTYQGDFSRLKNLKSQTETSKSLLDELSTNLRKMTIHKSILGPRHIKTLDKLDSDIKDIALRTQLAKMRWNYSNMDDVLKRQERYDKLTPVEKTRLDRLVEKIRAVKDNGDKTKVLSGETIKQTVINEDGSVGTEIHSGLKKDERELFFFPPTKKRTKELRKLIGIIDKESKMIDVKVDERKQLLDMVPPTGVSLRQSAVGVAAGLDTISHEIFGDLEGEKGAMRKLLSEAMNIYSNEKRMERGELDLLGYGDKEAFAKIMEILGRLRLARKASKEQAVDAFKKDRNLRKVISENTQRDIIEAIAEDSLRQADDENFESVFARTIDELFRRAAGETNPDKIEDLQDQLSAYRETYDRLYGSLPSEIASADELVTKLPTISDRELLEARFPEATTEPKPKIVKKRRRARGMV